MLYVTDRIGHNAHVKELTKMSITKQKEYGSNYTTNQHYPAVVPQMLESDYFDILVLYASSTDITNISPSDSEKYMKQMAKVSSNNMVTVARNCLTPILKRLF